MHSRQLCATGPRKAVSCLPVLAEVELSKKGKVVRGLRCCFELADDFALDQSIGERAGNKYIIQPQVWIPNGKRVAFVGRVKQAKAVYVVGVFHELNSF